MKKTVLAVAGVLTLFFAGCATSGPGAAGAPDSPVYEGDGVSLAEAIE
jgi:hypothetical protein